ncbi:MAG: single-stranded-DNA-specific exonuclease RecJ [Patescibacteria group bacterium]
MKNWKIREQVSPDLEKQLLSAKKIQEEDKNIFFEPPYENLYNPFDILDMDKAVDRILRAIKESEKIILFGDYDADGVCGTAIFFSFFEKIGFENFDTYIPDRHKEGYGLNEKVIDEFIENKVDLIITIDCGITDFEEIKKLKENNIDTIITDHHLNTGELPPALAIVDSKQKKDKYPFDMLCGAAVAFKVVQALINKGQFNIVPGWEKWLLDLVAIATVADMVPLIDENRTLTYYGLKVLQKTSRVGLLSFFKNAKLRQGFITEDDIAFTIAPRVNIASRMEHANTSYSLLTTKSKEEADWICKQLDSLNKDRRIVVEEILEEINKRLEGQKDVSVVVEGGEHWNKGVLGLTSYRILEKHNCPVFLWAGGDGEEIKGSCRSDGSVSLVELMEKIPEGILIEFGGHAFAAGFSICEGKTGEFKKEITKAFLKMDKKEVEDDLLIDKEARLEEINWSFLETIEKFAPFGMGNDRPVFLFKDVEVFGSKMFGNGEIHLQMDFKVENRVLQSIGFFMNNGFDVKKGDKIDLVASVERSTFKGFDELRLRIVDFHVK